MTNPIHPRIWKFDLTALMSPPTSSPRNLAYAAFFQLLIDSHRLTELYWHIVDGDGIVGDEAEVATVEPDEVLDDDDQIQPVEGEKIPGDKEELEVCWLTSAVVGDWGYYCYLRAADAPRQFRWTEPSLEIAMLRAAEIREEATVGRINRYDDKDRHAGTWDTTFDLALRGMHSYAKAISNINPADWRVMGRVQRVDLANSLMGDLPSPNFGPCLQMAYQEAVRAAALFWLPAKDFRLAVRAVFACLVLDACANGQTPAFVEPPRLYINRLREWADYDLCDAGLVEKLEAIANDERPAFRIANSSAYYRLKSVLVAAIGETDGAACSIQPTGDVVTISQVQGASTPSAAADFAAKVADAALHRSDAEGREAACESTAAANIILDWIDLRIIWTLTKTPHLPSVQDIAPGVGIDRGVVGSRLKRLAAAMFVEIIPDRRRGYQVTPAGKAKCPDEFPPDPRRRKRKD